MKKLNVLFAAMLIMASLGLNAQVAINTNGSSANGSAMLDVQSTTKGFLPPRMTTAQIGAIASPADGLLVYNTTDGKLYIYVSASSVWKDVTFGIGTISPPFVCGSTLTINHATGVVAPVTKTVTYGTVTNIPGETSKCWITSNLGADHQATSVDDATEASAGWYWQFNRKQGFKHDGTTRTPSTEWISSIDENSDWTSANDPCTLELGAGWRIPTSAEWTNVNESGSWTNWTGPWNSNLKIHAAGFLSDMNGGSLDLRGSEGYYWSSSQYSEYSYGSNLYFTSGFGNMVSIPKAYGLPLRCIRD